MDGLNTGRRCAAGIGFCSHLAFRAALTVLGHSPFSSICRLSKCCASYVLALARARHETVRLSIVTSGYTGDGGRGCTTTSASRKEADLAWGLLRKFAAPREPPVEGTERVGTLLRLAGTRAAPAVGALRISRHAPLCPRSHMRAQPFRTAVIISAAEDNFVAFVVAAFTAFGGTENWGPVDMFNPLQWLLFYAVQSTNSSSAMVRVLLDNGAEPAPLMLAVAVRPDDIALLLAAGARADVPCKNVYADAKRLPIGHALERGKVSRTQ